MDVNGDTLSRPHVGVCRLSTGYECDRLDVTHLFFQPMHHRFPMLVSRPPCSPFASHISHIPSEEAVATIARPAQHPPLVQHS